jgi:hypothetical protein
MGALRPGQTGLALGDLVYSWAVNPDLLPHRLFLCWCLLEGSWGLRPFSTNTSGWLQSGPATWELKAPLSKSRERPAEFLSRPSPS